MKPIRLITLAPGHFHAALVQKRMIPGVARKSFVYAPLDTDLVVHLGRLAAFNARPDDPTNWEIEVRAGANYLDRLLRETPGNTVVLSGRNRPKIDLILAAVNANLHVLADKPWVVEAADFPKLEQVMRDADLREVLTWDLLSERHEITNRLMRELIREPAIFGGWPSSTPDHPALTLESVHHLKKTVAGQPLKRPWWWFDPAVSGEAMADVGTHLADLALGFVAPDAPVDHLRDVAIVDADRWPLVLCEEQFRELTGLSDYPPELAPRVVGGQLYYAGNNSVTLTIRGVYVRLTTLWEYESAGGDTHAATARGTRATLTVRQPPGGPPDVFVSAAKAGDHATIVEALQEKCDRWPHRFAGLEVEDRSTEARVVIPDDQRTDHETHFAEVLGEFVRYFNAPRAVPDWERVNVLTRYFITTRAVQLARQKRPSV
jgi:predicted dehydrogenase